MRIFTAFACAVVLIGAGVGPGHAEKRVALVIGNKDYKQGVGALVNPLNDIRLVADALKSVGFEVLKPVQNATRREMLGSVYAFASALRAAGPDAVGFLYYSGHGAAAAGENYLIPIDVDEPSSEQLRISGVKQSEVLAILRSEAPNAAHYLVVDACRNTLRGARGGKSFVPISEESGVLVAFATAPGTTASDIGEGSGPYAAALAAELVRRGQDDLNMFHRVRVAVVRKTNGEQVPWTLDGIQRADRTVFAGRGGTTTTDPCAAAGDHWRSAEAIGTPAAFEDHLSRFPDCAFAGLARARADELKKKLVVVTPDRPVGTQTGVRSNCKKYTAVQRGAKNPSTIAIVTADTAADTENSEELRRQVKNQRLEQIVYDKAYPPGATGSDFVPIARAIQASNAAFIYHCADARRRQMLSKAADEIGLSDDYDGR